MISRIVLAIDTNRLIEGVLCQFPLVQTETASTRGIERFRARLCNHDLVNDHRSACVVDLGPPRANECDCFRVHPFLIGRVKLQGCKSVRKGKRIYIGAAGPFYDTCSYIETRAYSVK